jgi:hypothetical protein
MFRKELLRMRLQIVYSNSFIVPRPLSQVMILTFLVLAENSMIEIYLTLHGRWAA